MSPVEHELGNSLKKFPQTAAEGDTADEHHALTNTIDIGRYS